MAKYWSKVWNRKDVAIVLLSALIFLSYAISIALFFELSPPYALLVIDGIFILGTVTVFLILVTYQKIPLDKTGLVRPSIRSLVPALLLGVVFFAFGMGLAAVFGSLFGTSTGEMDTHLSLASDKKWLNILNFKLLIALGIPLAEELIFRGVVFRFLRQHRPFLTSALLSSLLFGLVHLHPGLMVFAFLLGLISATLFERTGSLLPSVVFHLAINNLGASMILLTLLE